ASRVHHGRRHSPRALRRHHRQAQATVTLDYITVFGGSEAGLNFWKDILLAAPRFQRQTLEAKLTGVFNASAFGPGCFSGGSAPTSVFPPVLTPTGAIPSVPAEAVLIPVCPPHQPAKQRVPFRRTAEIQPGLTLAPTTHAGAGPVGSDKYIARNDTVPVTRGR
ncbi:hypothetical protein HDU96_010886, partial [Phlyctochytrium bullatum]